MHHFEIGVDAPDSGLPATIWNCIYNCCCRTCSKSAAKSPLEVVVPRYPGGDGQLIAGPAPPELPTRPCSNGRRSNDSITRLGGLDESALAIGTSASNRGPPWNQHWSELCNANDAILGIA